MRQVENLLIVRVRMHRGHDSCLDAEALVQDLRHGREAVRSARRIRNDPVRGGIEGLLVDADAERDIGILRRSGDDHVLDALFQMPRRFVFARKAARRLHHDLHAEVAPRNVGGIGRGENAQRFAVDGDAIVRMADRVRDRVMHRVVLQQIRQRGRIGEIVDGDEFDAGIALERGTQHVASDAPETIDTNPDHCSSGNGS